MRSTLVNFVSIFLLIFGNQAMAKEKLVIFHAGSLSVPFQKMEMIFEKEHPNIDVVREPSGSVKAIRKVTDIHKPCDVIASADYSIIPAMMFPKYTDHVKIFASNELVICFTKKSRHASIINKENWHEILSKKDVKFGFSNPNLDPCGYRTLMLFFLASKFYNKPIFSLISETTNLRFSEKDGKFNIIVPENFRTTSQKVFTRPKAVALLGLLEGGAIDYAIEYKSIALQHGLKFIELPKEINLSSLKYKNYYSIVKMRLGNGKEVEGKPIAYGITVLKNASNPTTAKLWEDFVTSKEGAKILESSFQTPIYPAKTIYRR